MPTGRRVPLQLLQLLLLLQEAFTHQYVILCEPFVLCALSGHRPR